MRIFAASTSRSIVLKGTRTAILPQSTFSERQVFSGYAPYLQKRLDKSTIHAKSVGAQLDQTKTPQRQNRKRPLNLAGSTHLQAGRVNEVGAVRVRPEGTVGVRAVLKCLFPGICLRRSCPHARAVQSAPRMTNFTRQCLCPRHVSGHSSHERDAVGPEQSYKTNNSRKKFWLRLIHFHDLIVLQARRIISSSEDVRAPKKTGGLAGDSFRSCTVAPTQVSRNRRGTVLAEPVHWDGRLLIWLDGVYAPAQCQHLVLSGVGGLGVVVIFREFRRYRGFLNQDVI